MNTVSKGSIYSVSSSSPLFQTLLQGWKENMSTPGSKIIQARIDWTERNNLLPVLILGVKADKIRYAAHGGSEDIQFISLKEFNDDTNISLLDCKNNDDVIEWRKNNDINPPQSEETKPKKPKEMKVEKPKTVSEIKTQIEKEDIIIERKPLIATSYGLNENGWKFPTAEEIAAEEITTDEIQSLIDSIKSSSQRQNSKKD
jgi:hypothetical protein